MQSLNADKHRAFRTAARLANVRSVDQLEDVMRTIGRALAEQLAEADIPIKSRRFRPDVGHVQIDNCIAEEKVTKPHPVVRLQFEVDGGMGIDLKVKVVDFLTDPAGYTRDLFAHLGPMRRNVLRLRQEKRELNNAFYKALTEGSGDG
ncbi:hypothetical protein [Halomonas sp. NO4]|uniref:hypothetical protein n=1 Tax=Halomonas sp. NO4 TaxID=2484813 RepID=UPI0013D4804E|nr:hypothetical protein [Halomonas sp. NO4]